MRHSVSYREKIGKEKSTGCKSEDLKNTHVRLSGRVEDFEINHFVIHQSVECVDFFEIRIVFSDVSSGDKTNYEG